MQERHRQGREARVRRRQRAGPVQRARPEPWSPWPHSEATLHSRPPPPGFIPWSTRLAETTRPAHGGGEGERSLTQRRCDGIPQARIFAVHPGNGREGGTGERGTGDARGECARASRPIGAGLSARGQRRTGGESLPGHDGSCAPCARDRDVARARRRRPGCASHALHPAPQDIEQPKKVGCDGLVVRPHVSRSSQAESRPVAAARRSFHLERPRGAERRVSASHPRGRRGVVVRQAGGCSRGCRGAP